MASERMMHYSTLSSESKQALQSGDPMKLLSQFKKLQLLYKKGTANTKGALHRHVIAIRKVIIQHTKQLTGNMNKLIEMLKCAKDTPQNANATVPNEFCEPLPVKNEWESLSKRHMRNRKQVRFNTRKRVKALNSLEEVIYRHYYLKLTELTKMRESLPIPSYTRRAIARTNGMCLDSNNPYKERFRNLLFKVMAAWRPRDFIQRMIGSKKVHALCINIIHYISVCTSPGIDILENMEIIDNFFRILRRFKISSPVFRHKRLYHGGGPKKHPQHDKPDPVHLGKDIIGNGELSVKVVNSLSAILRGQFNQEYGLVNVRKLYKASRMTGSVSQKLKGYNLQSVPSHTATVQIHYCDNHYVTSEQRQTGIVVWDSVETTDKFKMELYAQLQLTYHKLSKYQYSDQPKGLITYKTDPNNMQKDFTSCGIFAVMRAFFVLSKTSSKIHTEIARSYLGSALEKYEFTDYDLFSSHHRNVKMQVTMEQYIRNQKELQSKKTQNALCDDIAPTVQHHMRKNRTKMRGRPRKRKYVQENRKSATHVLSHNVTVEPIGKRARLACYSPEDMYSETYKTELQSVKGNTVMPQKLKCVRTERSDASDSAKTVLPSDSVTSVKKRGRPPKLCTEEKKKRIKESKLKHYHKKKAVSLGEPTKMGRPSKYSPHEKLLQNRQKSLRHYHKSVEENTKEALQNRIEKHKKDLKSLRLGVVYKDRERAIDRQRHKNRRTNPLSSDKEKDRSRKSHEDSRKDPAFRKKEREIDKQWHKDKRENLSFREKEKERDRQWHKENRADPTKRIEENLRTNKRKYGVDEHDAIRKFKAATKTGPSVVCTCCLQLWFPDNCTALEAMSFPNRERVLECKTGTLFEGKEWLCSTCTRHLKDDRIPPISYANGMKFYDIPEELQLVQMEERCIALRQPFFQIRELPNGGQRSIKGNVVNVPMDVAKTIDALPRDLNKTETIGIKFKKKVSYKKCDYNENIRPQAVITAAKYLIANSELYQAHNVKINTTWKDKIAASTDNSLKSLMGCQDSEDTMRENSISPDTIEIDLTVSDDDVISLDSDNDNVNDVSKYQNSKADNTVLTVKYEKVDAGSCSSDERQITAFNTVDDNQVPSSDNGTNDMHENNTKSDDDTYSEIDEAENFSGNMDTMVDSPVLLPKNCTDIVDESNICDANMLDTANSSHKISDADALVIAPGEGQHPISLFNDPDAEYMAFPSIYCGRRRPIDTEYKTKKKPSKADIYKWECRAQDRRVATCIPDLFFKYKSLQIDVVENVVGISMRKVKGKKQPTAGELRTPEGRDKLINQNEGYSLFSEMRNTPPYYSKKKKNLLAVVRQEGMPSIFFTQSCADTRWPELLKVLGKLIDKKDYTDDEIENMSPINRNRLVAADPITVVRYFENKCHKFQQHIMNLRGSSRQFLRREFQNRGSPHSHEIHWIAGAPVYDPDKPENDKDVVKFIDTWISTKIEVSPEEEKYLKYQIHKHSNSCRKRGEAICRFGIPFFPMKTTCILKPLDSDEVDQQKRETLTNAYKELRKKLNQMGEGSESTHEEFLQNIQMSETDYILTIRSSLNTAKVFYERKPNALRVNPYMKGMLAVIKANHDVQYPLNIYALVCYVADYLLKSQKGLSATLEQAVRDAMDGDMKLKQQIRHIGYNLIGAIETSAPEAAYYIMQIPFTYSSVEVVFIPTCPPEDRLHVLKSEQELSELPQDSREVLKSNKITAYARRPKQLEGMCLADYVAELNVQYDKDRVQAQNEYDTVNDDCELDEDITDSDQGDSFITEDIFPLKVGAATFKKRKVRRVIRFVNYHRLRDEENYCREKLLLYKPWRREELLMGKHDSYRNAFHEHEYIIRHNMIKYEEYTEEVQEAEELIETVQNDDFDDIAPTTEQEERDAELIGPTDSTDYRLFKPPKQGELEQSASDILYEAGVSGTVDINIETMSRFLSEDKYLNMVRSLNEKQFQVYTHVMHHVSKGNPNPLRIFITGGAGVGKSMVLRCIYQGLLRLTAKKEGENAEDLRIIVAAPTGKAAYYATGTTIHSILKLLPNRNSKDYTKLSKEQRAALRLKFKNLHTIIIDEISMVGARMFRDINLRLQEIKGNKKLFGGLNVIVFGDLYQLSPIMDDWVFESLGKEPKNKKAKLQSADALAPNVWMENFTCFELTQVMRQKDDQPFCELLNRLREGNHTSHDIKTIKDNCELSQNVNPVEYMNIPHFCFKNADRNTHNQKVVQARQGKHVSVKSIDFCTQTNLPEKDRKRILDNVSKITELHNMGQLERVLDLKRGLQYDITINIDTEDGLCNGTSVVLQHMLYLDHKCPNVPSVLLVKPEDDQIGRKIRRKYRGLLPANTPESWIPLLTVHSQFMYLQKHPITRQQFPITLSAARTFHKAQGITLDKAVMGFPDIRKAGLHYVGLSRVTKMSGISILPGQFNADKIHVSELVQKEMLRLRSKAQLKLCYQPLTRIPSNFIVASFNAQSLHKHINDIKSDWNMKAASVLGICETRLKEEEDTSRYQVENFDFYHMEQAVSSTRRPYHGLALYVKKQLASAWRFSVCTDRFECIAVDVCNPSTKSKVLIIMCYKQPGTSNQILFTALEAMMEHVDNTQPLIIMGDFNVNKQDHSTLTAKISQILQCRQIITDVTTKSNTCIDLIFTNLDATTHGSIFTSVSHHHLTYAAFDQV